MPFERRLIPYVLMGITDVFAIGFGMGVPAFAILFGFPVGWWYVRRASAEPARGEGGVSRLLLLRLVEEAAVLACASLLVLSVIWGPQIPKALTPGFDAVGMGIPLILYTSRPSIIAWFILMLVVSPF